MTARVLWCNCTDTPKIQKTYGQIISRYYYKNREEGEDYREHRKPWPDVYFNMSTACQELQDQLAQEKLAKSLPIWAKQKRNDKGFLEVWT